MQPSEAVLYFAGDHSVLKSVSQLVLDNVTIDLFPEDVAVLNKKLRNCVPDILVLSVSDNNDWKAFFEKIYIDCAVVIINSSRTLNESDLFDIGADVVFSEDIPEATLVKWIQRKLFQLHSFKQLSQGAELAAQTANIAMTNSGELGRVIHFIEKTFEMKSSVELAKGMFSLSRRIGLKASVMFRWSNEDEEFFNCDHEDVSGEDKVILTSHFASGRILDFGNRTLFNYPMVSIFIKDMPLEDEERYGRVKDLLPIVLGAVNEKLLILDQEHMMHENACETIAAFRCFENTMQQLAETQNQNSTRAIMELTGMKEKIFYTLPGMGLEDNQEKYIETALEEALTKVIDSFNETYENTADLMQP